MRSVLSNLVFYLGLGLGLLIAGYFLLVSGLVDVFESFKNDPYNWLGALWGLIKTLLFVPAAFGVFFAIAAISLMIGDGTGHLRRVLVRWQDRADARYLRRQRTKSQS